MPRDDEDERLRSVALQNARSILAARQRAERELLRTKEVLVRRTQELAEESRQLELLNRTGMALASTLDLPTLLQLITDSATQLAGAAFGAYFYNTTDQNGDAYMLYTLSGAPREAFAHLGKPRATAVFGPTFRGEGSIRSDDITHDPRYGSMPPHHGMPPGHLPVRSYLAVPVVSRSGTTLGGLFFGHPQPGVFTERTERLVTGIAAQAAIAIDNARLHEDTKHLAEARAALLDAERAARSELERVGMMKDEFLATLSHELRTPLNAVLGWAEILLSRTTESSDTRRGLETILRNARAQAQLIEDLLDMNRIVSGKVRLDVQRVDVAAIVDAAVESTRPSADAKALQLRKVLDPGDGAIYGDPNRLQQVVWNLLTNAVKFTPKGGTVTVTARRVDDSVHIVVKDTGVGIAPQFLPHIFERFRQADSSTTRQYGGLGLGLSIVKQLVEMHGGSVRAHSAGLGEGAVFTVALPVGQGDSGRPDVGQLPAAAGVGMLADVTVLIVDDEPDARELLELLLMESKAQVRAVGSARDALDMIPKLKPHVLVSDIGMPDMDGYQLIRELRSLPPSEGGATPAIALTAFARSEDRTRAMLAGYQVHLSKPIEPQELIAAIRSLAGRATGARSPT